MTGHSASNSSPGGDHGPTTDGGALCLDALTLWLSEHPSATENIPDLVALAQTLARRADGNHCEECKRSGAGADDLREYRMVLTALHGVEGDDDGQEAFAASLRTSVLHPENPDP